MTSSIMTVGNAVALEKEHVIVRENWGLDGQHAPVVLYCHGAGGGANTVYDPPWPGSRALLRRLSTVYPVVTHDFGGSWTWAAYPLLRDRYDTVKAWAQNSTGKVRANTGKVICVGASMGSLQSLMYAHNRPANVYCVVGILPLVDLAYMRNNDTGSQGFRESINAAHGLAVGSTGDYPVHGTSLSQLPANVDPYAERTTFAANGIPIQLWGANNDTITPEARALAFEAAVPNCDYISLGNTGGEGHSETSIAAVDLNSIMNFIAAAVAAG